MNIRIYEYTNTRIKKNSDSQISKFQIPRFLNSYSSGFTLIELLVAVSIILTIAVVSTSVFITTMRSNTRTQISTDLKQKGDYALTVMERMIRQAEEITTCEENRIGFVFKDGQTTIFQCDLIENQLASDSADYSVLLIDKINCNDFQFNCNLPQVDIDFSLTQNPDDPLPFMRPKIEFKTSVTARNL